VIFPEILGNPVKMERKGFLVSGECREMSSSATTTEKREVHASGLLFCMQCHGTLRQPLSVSVLSLTRTKCLSGRVKDKTLTLEG